MRLLYQRAVTQRCSSGALSAVAVSCSPKPLKESAQTPTWQMDAMWLLRHRHRHRAGCAAHPWEDGGLAAGRAASLSFLKYLFSNNWTCCVLPLTQQESVWVWMGWLWVDLKGNFSHVWNALSGTSWNHLKSPDVGELAGALLTHQII